MNGTVDRRNQSEFWAGKVTWLRLKLKRLPVCEDCLINIHEARRAANDCLPNEGWLPRARWRRTNAVELPAGVLKTVVEVCDTHRQEWLDWTPGQMSLGAGGGFA